MAKDIEYIDINLLHPHPDNPRKELGDLTELSEGIKAKGILQNLTVVKEDEGDGYKIVIGHRRCAAAKLAGLTELPCVIAEMSYKEQLETMMQENMQRSDLNPMEQGLGFQLMIDMGDSVDEVSKSTGLSKTTVKKRLNIAKLDPEKLKKACSRQVTLGDFDKLAQIDDIEKRNELLDKMGTSNFEYALQDALRKQDVNKNAEEWRKLLTKCKYKFKEIKENEAIGKYSYVAYYSCKPDLEQVKNDVKKREISIENTQLFFKISKSNYLSVNIFVEKPKKTAEEIEREQEEQKERQAMDEKRAAIVAIAKTAYECRKNAIAECSSKTAKEAHDKILSILIENQFDSNYVRFDEEVMLKILGIKFKKPKSNYETVKYDEVKEGLTTIPSDKLLLVYTYCCLNDNEKVSCYDYYLNHYENKVLNIIYRLLDAIGYEKSDEEKRFLEGRALE